MNEFVIEKNIPIPQKIAANGLVATLCKTEIGDSVFAAAEKPANIYAAKNSAQRKSGFVFASRKVEGGYRFWRLE